MNYFMRAIGLSKYDTKINQRKIADYVRENAQSMSLMSMGHREWAKEYRYEFTKDLACVLHTTQTEDGEYMDYIIPCVKGSVNQCTEPVTIERKTNEQAFLGTCDDGKSGINLVFYVTNYQQYSEKKERYELMQQSTAKVYLSALSVEAKVLLPIEPYPQVREKQLVAERKRRKIKEAANKGDINAIQILSFEKMEEINTAYQRIEKEDLFSVVETSFMPYGLECDRYSIVGNIRTVDRIENPFTKERVLKLMIECNELVFEIFINEEDLFGEPLPGRRIKASIWLQGEVILNR